MRKSIVVLFVTAFVIGYGSSNSFALSFSKNSSADPIRNFVEFIINHPEEGIPLTRLDQFIEKQFAQDDQLDYSIEQIREILDYLVFLQSRVQFVTRNNALLISFLDSAVPKTAGAVNRFKEILKREEDILKSSHDEGIYKSSGRPGIRELYYVCKKIESMLIARARKLQVVNDDLRALKIEMLALRRGQLRGAGTKNTEDISEVKKNLEQKETVIAQQEKSINDLKQQFSQVQLGLDMFRDRLQGMNQRVEDLVKEVASRSLDLYDKDRMMANAREQTQELASELAETKERLRLVQRIVQEKDDHIQSLEKEVLDVQAHVSALPTEREEVAALRDEISEEIQKLSKDVVKSRDKIVRLEKRFQEVALLNAHLESELLKSTLAVAFLEKQNEQKQHMISDLEKSSELRTQKINEIKGIVKIYQLKLQDYKHMLRQKNLEIRSYRQQTSRVKAKKHSLNTLDLPTLSLEDVCAVDRLGCLLWTGSNSWED